MKGFFMDNSIEQTRASMQLINKYVDAMFAYDSLKSEENYKYLEAIKQEYKDCLGANKNISRQSF